SVQRLGRGGDAHRLDVAPLHRASLALGPLELRLGERDRIAVEPQRTRKLRRCFDQLGVARILSLRRFAEARCRVLGALTLPLAGTFSLAPSPGSLAVRFGLSAGALSPVPEPTPAVPLAMPGLSSFSSAGAIGAGGSRAAFARVGRAGSLPFRESGFLAMRRI